MKIARRVQTLERLEALARARPLHWTSYNRHSTRQRC